MMQSTEDGGAGLTPEELTKASRNDEGGHSPIDIWRGAGGDESFARFMKETIENAPKLKK